MEPKKHKEPMQENTKDDSSDVERVRQDKQGPPPEPKTGQKPPKRDREHQSEKERP